MGKSIKLGVIGAGSAVFSLGLVRDLCLQESLRGSLVTFMDVDEDRLRTIHRLAQRYVQELGVDLRFEATLERAAALRDADFVLNTALVGGHEWEVEITRVAEARGFYRGLGQGEHQTQFHQYALMLSLAQDIERICPQAWLIQSSNPVFEGCTLMTRETGAKVIGLCHGFHGFRQIATAIGVPPDEVVWQAPGVNHWIYLTEFRHRGQDLYPKIDEWIASKGPAYWASFKGSWGENHLSRAAMDHYRRVGLMPIGDAARAFDQWYYHADLTTKQRWYGHLGGFESEIGWGMYLRNLEQRLARIRDVAADERGKVTEAFPPQKTREIQVPIIDAIADDRPGVFQVNVPNCGAIENIAADVVVEGKAQVDGSGVKLLHVGKLPPKLMQMVLGPRIARAEKSLAAWLTGDRDLFVSYLLDDHRTRSLEHAEDVVDAFLDLPFNAELKARFGPRRPDLPPYHLAAPNGAVAAREPVAQPS